MTPPLLQSNATLRFGGLRPLQGSASARVQGALAALIIASMLASPLESQTPDSVPAVSVETPPERTSPATSLVLSGGGSRGLAHAGALEAIDSLGYRPELVIGTSMGALVGALYAAGYTPGEIQERVVAVDWGETFTPAPLVLGPDRVARYPFVIMDSDPDPLRFSRGFIPQWRVNREIMRLLFDAGVRSQGDFDRLARRYRAVAADIRDGGQVVIGEGDLARAVRASIAVPGFLAPIEIEGRFLVDGGIADNLPVGVARDLSGEPVIAVDVRIPTENVDARSPLQVANRAIDLMMRNARQDTLPPEFLVQPAIPAAVTGFVFPTDPEALFDLGREAILESVAPRPEGPASQPTLPAAPEGFANLRVEAPDAASEALVRRVLQGIVPGPYDPERTLIAIDRLYTTGFFEGVWPRVEPNASGLPDLVVRVEGLPDISIAAALGYDSDRGGRFWTALRHKVTLFGAPAAATLAGSLTPIEQWAELSAHALLPAWPLLGLNAGAYLREVDVRRFEIPGASDLEVVRAGGWVGTEIQQSLSARIATLVFKGEWVDPEEGADGFAVGPLLRLAVPAAKQPIVGVQPELELEARWGDFTYQRGEIRLSRGLEIGRFRTAVVGDLIAASADAPLDALPALGDDHAMPGYRWGEGRGPVRALAGFDIAYPIPFQGYLRSRVRTGAIATRIGDLEDTDQWITGGELGVVWRTPFGSLGIAYSRGEGGEQNLVLDLGQEF